MAPTLKYRIVVSGCVQGVGYRWSMTQMAQGLGLRGWVRNRRDGTVEALVLGAPDAVNKLVQWAHHGPPAAAVQCVQVSEPDAPDEADRKLDRFTQQPTC
ncbi:MAG: acylphosphatase [Burkholderiaceae bacterium]